MFARDLGENKRAVVAVGPTPRDTIAPTMAARLWAVEMLEIAGRRRWPVPLSRVPFAVGVGLTVTVEAVFHETIMVGSGFVDEGPLCAGRRSRLFAP